MLYVLGAFRSPIHSRTIKTNLFLSVLALRDVEVTKLVGALVRGNHAKVVTEVELLQVLLGQVLQEKRVSKTNGIPPCSKRPTHLKVTLGERDVRDNYDALARFVHVHGDCKLMIMSQVWSH